MAESLLGCWCPGLLFHDMRRTAARNFRRGGVAEGVIMRVGGWRTRSVFERYNIVSQADITDALHKLEAAQKSGTSEIEHNFEHNPRRAERDSKPGRVNQAGELNETRCRSYLVPGIGIEPI